MTVRFIEIGGFKIPVASTLQIQQRYDYLPTESKFRSLAGDLIKQSTYNKMKITTTGSGWMPPGLSALNTRIPLVLKCIEVMSIPGDGTVVLPSGKYRTDAGHEPFGLCRVGSSIVKTTITGGVCDVVSGGEDYVICYYPQYTVYADKPVTYGDPNSANTSWELVCEEA